MTHLFALSAAAADIMNISLRSRLSAARLTYIDSLHGTSRQQSFTASLLLDEAIRLCCPSVPRPLDIAANENGEVLDEQGNPIPGLYAAGEVVCGTRGVGSQGKGLSAVRHMLA